MAVNNDIFVKCATVCARWAAPIQNQHSHQAPAILAFLALDRLLQFKRIRNEQFFRFQRFVNLSTIPVILIKNIVLSLIACAS